MGWVIKTALIILLNALVFWGMATWLKGFTLIGGFGQTAIIAAVFTALNLVLKPVLKLILGPIIILTLGLGLILVNMLILYILDRLTNNLTIDGVVTLLYAALIVGVANFFLHWIFKKR